MGSDGKIPIDANPGMSSGALGRALLTTPQAVTMLIRQLSSAGMITQEQPPRAHAGALYLTEKGANRLLAAAELASQPEKENPPGSQWTGALRRSLT